MMSEEMHEELHKIGAHIAAGLDALKEILEALPDEDDDNQRVSKSGILIMLGLDGLKDILDDHHQVWAEEAEREAPPTPTAEPVPAEEAQVLVDEFRTGIDNFLAEIQSGGD